VWSHLRGGETLQVARLGFEAFLPRVTGKYTETEHLTLLCQRGKEKDKEDCKESSKRMELRLQPGVEQGVV
jgi:hypothetical protein